MGLLRKKVRSKIIGCHISKPTIDIELSDARKQSQQDKALLISQMFKAKPTPQPVATETHKSSDQVLIERMAGAK